LYKNRCSGVWSLPMTEIEMCIPNTEDESSKLDRHSAASDADETKKVVSSA